MNLNRYQQIRIRVREDALSSTRVAAKAADPEQARRKLLRLLEEQLGRLPIADRSPVACRAGCAFCCHLRVMVTPVEVFGLLNYLAANLSTEQFAAFKRRVAEASRKLSELEHRQVLTTNIPCPVLVDGRCSGYAARPLNCRSYHSLDRDACEKSFENPADFSLKHPQFTAVAHVHEGAQSGFIAGLGEVGYDNNQYELVIALQEALDDPEAHVRFRHGKKAFLRNSPV